MLADNLGKIQVIEGVKSTYSYYFFYINQSLLDHHDTIPGIIMKKGVKEIDDQTITLSFLVPITTGRGVEVVSLSAEGPENNEYGDVVYASEDVHVNEAFKIKGILRGDFNQDTHVYGTAGYSFFFLPYEVMQEVQDKFTKIIMRNLWSLQKRHQVRILSIISLIFYQRLKSGKEAQLWLKSKRKINFNMSLEKSHF